MKQAKAEMEKDLMSALCFTLAAKDISESFQRFGSYNAPSMQHLMDHALNRKTEKLFSTRDSHTQKVYVAPGILQVSRSES